MSKLYSGAEIVFKCLEDQKVDHVFGYPGGAVLPIYDELTKYLNKKIKLKQAEELITIKTRQYAKRQTTWARTRMIEWTKIGPQQLSSTIKKINKSSLKLDQLI